MSDTAPSRPSKVDAPRERNHERSPERPHERAPGSSSRRDPRSLFVRLVEFLSPGPDSTAELIQTLADAEHRELIEPESRVMLEGVIRMAGMSAGDVMVAAPRMDLLSIDADYEALLATVIVYDLLQRQPNPLAPLRPVTDALDRQRLCDRPPHPQPRIQRPFRMLHHRIGTDHVQLQPGHLQLTVVTRDAILIHHRGVGSDRRTGSWLLRSYSGKTSNHQNDCEPTQQ